MIENTIGFIAEYWWGLLVFAMTLGFVLFMEYEYQKNSSDEKKNILLTDLVLFFSLFIPLLFSNKLNAQYGRELVSSVYFFYIGTLLIVSFYYPKHNFIFRSFDALLKIKHSNSNIWSFVYGIFFCCISLVIFVISILEN